MAAVIPSTSIVITESEASAPWRRATEHQLIAVLPDEVKCLCPMISQYVGAPVVPKWTGLSYDDQSRPHRRTDEHLTMRPYGGTNEHENVCRVLALLDRDVIADVEMSSYANQSGAFYYRFYFRVRVHVPEESLWPDAVYAVQTQSGSKGPWPLPFGGPTLYACPPSGTIYRLTSTGAMFDLQRRQGDYDLRFVRRSQPNDALARVYPQRQDAAPAARAI